MINQWLSSCLCTPLRFPKCYIRVKKDENKSSDANLPQIFIVLFLAYNNLSFTSSFSTTTIKTSCAHIQKPFSSLLPYILFPLITLSWVFPSVSKIIINLHRKLLDLALYKLFHFQNITVSISSLISSAFNRHSLIVHIHNEASCKIHWKDSGVSRSGKSAFFLFFFFFKTNMAQFQFLF